MRQVAWVTGAGRGIGQALALRLEGEGWEVAISSRTYQDLEEICSNCKSDHIHAYPLDVTDAKSTVITVKKIERDLGEIHLAILNAGAFVPFTIENFSQEKFRFLVETNLMGSVNSLAEIIPRFISRKNGTIAIVASLAGYRGLPSAAAYGATKAGLINMCESLKPELEKYNIKISLINPGFVKTPLTDLNNFKMPFLISTEEAVDCIIEGLKKNDFEITFPKIFAFIMRFLSLLPYRLYFYLTHWITK